MLNDFIDQVVSQGAEALLPQNLDEQWLDMIFVAARNFLKVALNNQGEIREEDVLNDVNSMMMLSAIVEIAQHQNGYQADGKPYEIPEEDMFEFISCYALCIILESVARQTDLPLKKPDLDDIFERDRLYNVEQDNPGLTEVLNKLMIEE